MHLLGESAHKRIHYYYYDNYYLRLDRKKLIAHCFHSHFVLPRKAFHVQEGAPFLITSFIITKICFHHLDLRARWPDTNFKGAPGRTISITHLSIDMEQKMTQQFSSWFPVQFVKVHDLKAWKICPCVLPFCVCQSVTAWTRQCPIRHELFFSCSSLLLRANQHGHTLSSKSPPPPPPKHFY